MKVIEFLLDLILIVELEDNKDCMINDKPTVVFFHGNSGNIGNRLEFVNTYIMHCDVNVMIGKYFINQITNSNEL